MDLYTIGNEDGYYYKDGDGNYCRITSSGNGNVIDGPIFFLIAYLGVCGGLAFAIYNLVAKQNQDFIEAIAYLSILFFAGTAFLILSVITMLTTSLDDKKPTLKESFSIFSIRFKKFLYIIQYIIIVLFWLMIIIKILPDKANEILYITFTPFLGCLMLYKYVINFSAGKENKFKLLKYSFISSVLIVGIILQLMISLNLFTDIIDEYIGFIILTVLILFADIIHRLYKNKLEE